LKRIALATVGAAVVGLTACSSTATPAAAPASNGPTSVTRTPVNCSQQYHTWTHGQGKGLIAALHSVSLAGTAGDPQALTIALKKAGPVVGNAAHHPIPACADPRGYWAVLLMHVNAAVASRHSPSSLRAAMKGVPKIEHELTAEVKSTSGR
jgi:hypothetical protein